MAIKTFYKSQVVIDIISEEEIGDPSLEKILYQITEGDWSGSYSVKKVEVLTDDEARKALISQGSDPDFFSLGEVD